MVEKAKQVFGEEEKITVVADTGYFNMSEIINTVDDNTEILIKKKKGSQEKTESGFDKENFQYDKENDIYKEARAKRSKGTVLLLLFYLYDKM